MKKKRNRVHAGAPPKVKTKPGPKRPFVEVMAETGIEAVCDMIVEGLMFHEVARKLGVKYSSIMTWISDDDDRSARITNARRVSAHWWEWKAEQALKAANDTIGIQRARELAHHYRWRASKIAPREYGDKVEISHTGALGKLTDEQLANRVAACELEIAALEALAGKATPPENQPSG